MPRASDVANHAKDEFLATVSHELRTPLNAILGWAKMLPVVAAEPTVVAQATSVIERNSVAMARLVDDLLDVSRIVSGKVRLEVQPVKLLPTLTGPLRQASRCPKPEALRARFSRGRVNPRRRPRPPHERRVRALPALRGGGVPAIALTAYTRVEERRRALAAGFAMHVPKPVDPAELVAVVASLLRLLPMARAIRDNQ